MRHIRLLLLLLILPLGCDQTIHSELRLYEPYDIVLEARDTYTNPYMEVDCWVDLRGPGFEKRIYGFWNGGSEYIVRIAVTAPGDWAWESGSNVSDRGLRGKKGSIYALGWSKNEIEKNPNLRGYIRTTKNGHALEYEDGAPFLMLGDTWWGASTWRYPIEGEETVGEPELLEGMSFEDMLAFRKSQGYNTIAMIASFPNWKADSFPSKYINPEGVGIRQAWENSGGATAKDMHDEEGNLPFRIHKDLDPLADFEHINPLYFQNLDRKMHYLWEQGFVTFLETLRRDHGPGMKTYFEWPGIFERYVQYISARYGAYNIIFSGIHLDWISNKFGLSAEDFNSALTSHLSKYGPLPYGQPHSILINSSTYHAFGHGDQAPWLTMHAVGNSPRNHGFYPMLEEIFSLEPPFPAANLEPYYPGWDHKHFNLVAGERPEPNSERDNYFARAQMYGSVFSGGLAGHIYGTGAYDGTRDEELREEGERPYLRDAFSYSSGAQVGFLKEFILSTGDNFQECRPSRDLLIPNTCENAPEDGLDGWSYFLLSDSLDLGFLYFENASVIPIVKGLPPDQTFKTEWFDVITGIWAHDTLLTVTPDSLLTLGAFPGGDTISQRDWALRIKAE